ncbi:MAG: DNA replication/repair protein RecF [Clostridia bacterium]|nr:DNA replication/repair protein RecF [Clostridia bacterium]
MSAIELKQLQLTNFRSYNQLSWECKPGLNIIQGPNAAGKTNLLEAIGYLSFVRSIRQQQDQKIMSRGSSFFKIKGLCLSNKELMELDIVYQNNNKKLTINRNQHRLIDLLGIFPVIFFGPDDLYLVKGSPFYRRQYLDREISIRDRSYCQCLQTYRRILLQRNRLLREIKYGNCKVEELIPWNSQMVATGIIIIHKRRHFLEALAPLVQEIYAGMGAGEYLSLHYKPNIANEEDWLAKITVVERQEIEVGMSLWGPHRDDFTFLLDDFEARFFASQGQQRSAVLALKIAEANYFRQTIGVMPVLLLDDVFSELDLNRQSALLELLQGAGQTFLTTTEIARLPQNLICDATLWQLDGDNSDILKIIN